MSTFLFVRFGLKTGGRNADNNKSSITSSRVWKKRPEFEIKHQPSSINPRPPLFLTITTIPIRGKPAIRFYFNLKRRLPTDTSIARKAKANKSFSNFVSALRVLPAYTQRHTYATVRTTSSLCYSPPPATPVRHP